MNQTTTSQMKKLLIPACYLSPSFRSFIFDLLSIVLLTIGTIASLLTIKNPITFIYTFLMVRAISIGSLSIYDIQDNSRVEIVEITKEEMAKELN